VLELGLILGSPGCWLERHAPSHALIYIWITMPITSCQNNSARQPRDVHELGSKEMSLQAYIRPKHWSPCIFSTLYLCSPSRSRPLSSFSFQANRPGNRLARRHTRAFSDDYSTHILERNFLNFSDVICTSATYSTIRHFGKYHRKSVSRYLNHTEQVLFSLLVFCLCCARLNFTTTKLDVYGKSAI
jgi:hypothetical protein